VGVATLFKSEAKDLVERLQSRAFSTPDEKRALCEELAGSPQVKVVDAVRLLFHPDGDVRKAAGRLLATRRDAETVRHFLEASKGRPEPARRAALAMLATLGLGDVVSQVGTMVEQGDPATRKVATEALLDLPLTSETAPLLVKVIEGGEAAHRLRAVTRFAEIAQERNLAFFERLLDDADERIRFAAWQAMIKFAKPQGLELFLKRIGDEPYATQQVLIQAIQALVPQAGPQGVQQVLGLLASGKTALRTAALKILLSLPDRVGVIRQLITYSLQLAGWVRDRALESLREFGPQVMEPAIELLGDRDAEVRSAAMALASSFQDPRVTAAAARLLEDEDWWLGINAADVLGRARDPGSVPALVKALQRDDIRWAAVEALGRVGGPQALQALSGLVRDPRPEIRIEALSALAISEDARVLPLLQHSAEGDPIKWVRARAFDLARDLARKKSTTLDEARLRAAVAATEVGAGSPDIHRLLALARRQGASDLHVSVDSVPVMRVGGQLARLQGQPLSAEATASLLAPLLSPDQARRLEEAKQLDACFHVENDGRYRGNLFVDRKGLNGVFRVIPEQPPTITDLGLPSSLSEIALIHQGIIIVTGPAGCGKTTTLASLVNLVNETRRAHVLTLEDPVEFVHPFKQSLVNQREVGKHTDSFAKALRAALRENPDVIVIGEMRDPETVSLALTAAETGHVVLATMNATTAPKAVERIIASFPADEQAQVRESFADALKLVLAQQLLPATGGRGRVACFELLKANHAIANLIRDSKTFQLPSIMQIGQSTGQRTFDDSLMELVRTGKVAPEVAYLRAASKDAFEPLVPPRFLEELLA
jgi:twitching motility protein PilT